MNDRPKSSADPQSQQLLLSIWDDEGGAGRCGPKESTAHPVKDPIIPDLTNTELVQLRVRLIALENLVTALLSAAPCSQHALVRAMAEQISPRAGVTPHPLTIQAAAHMNDLVDRAIHYRSASVE
jgi:hypothetical protein